MDNRDGRSDREDSRLLRELEASRFIHKQIAKLSAAQDLRKAIDEILCCVGEFLQAERCYIFEKDGGETYSNTHEWCAEGVSSEIDTLQGIPAEELILWLRTLRRNECVVISNIENVRESDPFVYETLARQNIVSVVEAPIEIDHQLAGFIGVDNAPGGVTDVIAESLTVLGAFIGTMLGKESERRKLSESHDMRQEILSGISCGVLAFTIPDHDVLAINHEARRMLGCEAGDDPMEAFMTFMKERVLPEDRAHVSMINLQQPGDEQMYAYGVQTKEGILYIKSKVKLLQLADGRKYMLCSLLDITEQVELAASLEKERKSYRDALANGSEFTFFFDISEGLVREEFVTAHGVNLVKLMGLSVPVSYDELLKRYVERMNIQFQSEGMAKYFTCAGLLDAYERGVTNVLVEYYNPYSDFYIRANCLMSRDKRSGHIHGSVVATDITEARKLEKTQREALREANAKLARVNDEMSLRLDAIVNGISGGLKIAEATDNFRYTYISEGAAALQGYTVSEFMALFGDSVISNIYPGEGAAALAEANRQIEENGVYEVKYRVPHRDGSSRWVIDRGKLVEDHMTGRTYYYILMQDVTELETQNQMLNNTLSIQREISASLGSGILAYTIPDRRILLLNRETERMFGCRGETGMPLEMDIMRFVAEEDLPAMRAATARLKRPGDRAEYTFHYQTGGSGVKTYRCSTARLCFESGQEYILSSISDVTELERMEKRIAEERLQYRNALIFGSTAFFSINLTDGCLKEHIISREGENLTARLGLKLPATYSQMMEAWFGENRIVSASPEIERVRSLNSILTCCENGPSVIDFEYFVPADERYFHVMVLLDSIGDNPRATFILHDITADRRGDQQRRTVIETLGKIYSSLYHLLLREGRYVAYKRHEDAMADLTETGELAVFLDTYVNRYVLPEFREQVANFMNPETIRANLAATDYVSIEYRRRNAGWCHATLVAADRDDQGVVTSVVFAGSVIEEQKQRELSHQEALKVAYEAANIANSAKTDFLANMSHDIRTPMNAIIGMTAIAGTHLDDRERVADCLSKITVSSKHLLGLINEVLDMSKIESGKMELQEEEFVLPELVENLLTMSKSGINAKGHALTVDIHNIEHEKVIGDSQRIQQVFMNIMSNAIKYTPEGGRIHLTISEKPTNRQKIGCYEFIFEDNGIGMSEEYMAHLFEPFVRARDDARVKSIQGTGLGMPITKNIIEMMNGTIQVQSRLNEGTKVTITFFLKLWGEEEIDYDRLVNLPVLVADDDESSCEYACHILGEIGMKGEGVLSGEEAVARVAEHHRQADDYFAVILDWKMPGVDGVEATKRIRREVGSDVPVIIISAYDWSDIEPAARAAGASAFISKPLFKSRVAHLFNELVGGEAEEPKDAAMDALAHENYAGRSVLLVEDNELNAEIASEILGMAGLTVKVAENGKEAVDIMAAARDNEYDIVFMDIQMPVMNGYEAARAIRALPGSYTRSVPIIAMTANAFAEDVAAAKNAGMNEHMAKPIDFEHLVVILKKWLG